MELSFSSEQLRSTCESRRIAVKLLGVDAARSLEGVLADIDACETLSELEGIYGGFEMVDGAESWVLTVAGRIRVRFTSGHVRTAKRKDGEIIRNEFTRIKIELIEAEQ